MQLVKGDAGIVLAHLDAEIETEDAHAQDLPILAGDDEARRLTNADFLLQVTVEEGGLDVHVMDKPTLLCRQRKDTDGLLARDEREGVVVVDPLLLNEPTRHQPRLVLDHLPCLVLLDPPILG